MQLRLYRLIRSLTHKQCHDIDTQLEFLTRFQASYEMQMKCGLFWNITQRRLVVFTHVSGQPADQISKVLEVQTDFLEIFDP